MQNKNSMALLNSLNQRVYIHFFNFYPLWSAVLSCMHVFTCIQLSSDSIYYNQFDNIACFTCPHKAKVFQIFNLWYSLLHVTRHSMSLNRRNITSTISDDEILKSIIYSQSTSCRVILVVLTHFEDVKSKKILNLFIKFSRKFNGIVSWNVYDEFKS